MKTKAPNGSPTSKLRPKPDDAAATDRRRDGKAAAPQKTQADRLFAAVNARGIKRIRDTAGAPYLVDGCEVLPVDGQEASDLLHRTARDNNLLPNPTAVKTVINMLRAEAMDPRMPAVRVYQRWAHIDGTVYYDLGGWPRRAVVITEKDWSIADAPEAVLFCRPSGYEEQAAPVSGGALDELRPLISLDDEEWLLFKALLLSPAQADGLPRPITTINGEQDSGKTSISRVMGALLDPRSVSGRSKPKSERDLIAALNSCFVLILDNVSWLDAEMCDTLCLCATGRGLAVATRTLYTTAGETRIKALRPIILNGIPDAGTRSLISSTARSG